MAKVLVLYGNVRITIPPVAQLTDEDAAICAFLSSQVVEADILFEFQLSQIASSTYEAKDSLDIPLNEKDVDLSEKEVARRKLLRNEMNGVKSLQNKLLDAIKKFDDQLSY